MGFTIRAFPLLSILISSLLIQTAISVDPLFSICSSTSQNYTTNSPYETNLNNLLGNLYLKTPPTGFGLSSSGQSPNRAYGLSLCRGDASTDDCRACLVDASSEITKRCPNNRGAIIWYDNCYLKYLDNDFFGNIDTSNRFYMWNLRNVTNPEVFNRKVSELLSKLSENVSETTIMFANGTVERVVGNETIYGMVQCSRDLSKGDCKRCVDDAISELPRCCNGSEGGRVVGGSCNVRYEIYQFLNV
ncbi:hypothetical protein CASFOL_031351 [Castilleja foliolosa]|uniref:Gnk2-homologous domain-containing protein n=1 Tax=Castilleja foliolosa TaxID=1961234 RepID=A0ABD3C4G3_9LAMI